jgi:hypothetical protein
VAIRDAEGTVAVDLVGGDVDYLFSGGGREEEEKEKEK